MPGSLPLPRVFPAGHVARLPPQRKIRSYVLRGGRTTQSQQLAIQKYWDRWGMQPVCPPDIDLLFGRSAPCVLEVGFGSGDSLLAMAEAMPEINFIGIEVYPSGIGRLLQGIVRREIKNIRIWRGDAQTMLESCIPPEALDAVQIFFPDPWPKSRHRKRRLVGERFLALCASRLCPRGLLHLATDWEDYAREMLAAAGAEKQLENAAGTGRFAPRAPWRPITCFEGRAHREGRNIFELLFLRCGR